MRKINLIGGILLLIAQTSVGQSGGLSAFNFLNFNTSSRAAALG
jgi:hypothetical protein